MSVASRRQGFSLIEALAAVALIGVGIVATVECLGAITRGRIRVMETEHMQRLAHLRYEELMSRSSLPSAREQGDFRDIGENGFIWRSQTLPTGTTNLESLRIEVAPRGDDYTRGARIEALFTRPKAGGS